MAVVDEILARLRSIPGVAAVFDTALPTGHTVPNAPVLVLHHISTVPEVEIAGGIAGSEDRWQVSVRASTPPATRAGVQAVRDALHGYQSDTIAWCGFESAPGVAQESASPSVFHAPVDFLVQY